MKLLREGRRFMKLSRLLVLAAFLSACGGVAIAQRSATADQTPADVARKQGEAKTSTDPQLNPDAALMADLNARVEKYADLHKQLARGGAKPKQTNDPRQIAETKAWLAAKVQGARADAKHGDIFTLPMRNKIRRLLAPELKGEDGRDAKALLKDDAPAPGTITFKVNAKYPDSQPLPTVPANLLLNLPTLPEPLEYRIVGKHLILLDTAADLVVDYVPNAIP
jgi:hypothetical protein